MIGSAALIHGFANTLRIPVHCAALYLGGPHALLKRRSALNLNSFHFPLANFDFIEPLIIHLIKNSGFH